MLAANTEVKGSAGYVAIERVSGQLHGRAGTFILQHSGTMNRGAPQLSVTVVPDSGTGALTGLAGRMTIDIAGGQHSYVFEYTLPGTAWRLALTTLQISSRIVIAPYTTGSRTSLFTSQ